jgi:hypothetical protein
MKTIELIREAGPDRTIHVDIPVEEERRYRLVITLSPEQATNGPPLQEGTHPDPSRLSPAFPTHVAWPAEYWREVFGGWEGDFVRDQGEPERRESW